MTVPLSLIAERDELIQKRDKVRNELAQAQAEVAEFRRARTARLAWRNGHGN